MNSDKQTLIIVICRLNLDPSLIPPFKIILPMLTRLFPVRVFTSLDGQIKSTKTCTLYQELVKKLEVSSGQSNISRILENIIDQYDGLKSKNYRLCLMGHQRIDWGVIIQFKRRGIVIDTVCSANQQNQLSVQISYITEGIHKVVKQSTLIKIFQTELSTSRKIRSLLKMEKKQTVQFSVRCKMCSIEVTGGFLACSVCLQIFCPKHQNIKQCIHCGYYFD